MFQIKLWDERSSIPLDIGRDFCEQSNQESKWVTLSGSDQRLVVPQILDNWRSGKSILMLSHLPDDEWVSKVEETIRKEFQRGLHIAVTTSGSTGEPKVVVHEVARLFKAARSIIDELHIEPASVLNFFHPLYMAGVLNNLVLAMELGTELVLFENFIFKSPGRLSTWLQNSDEKFNIWLSPKMAQVLLTVLRNNSDLSDAFSKRILSSLSATGPLPIKTQEEFLTLTGSRLINTFGTTEHLFIATDHASDVLERSQLRFMRGVKGRIRDRELTGDSKPGVLEVSTPYQARMVLESENFSIRRKVLGEGELRPTGDLASLDERTVFLSGRTDSLLVQSGLNVSLELLERTVREVAGVSDCFAYESGGRLDLVVESLAEKEPLSRYLRLAIDKALPGEYRPRRIQVVAELPRTFSGKIDRQAILLWKDAEASK